MAQRRTLTGLIGGALAVVMFAPPASAQSLAEVARMEKARRERIGEPSKVYTNDDLRGGDRLTTGNSRAIPTPTAAPGSGPVEPGSETQPEETFETAADRLESGAGPRDQQEYWQNRISTARAAKERAALMGAALQNRVDGLWAEFTAVDDPAQRSVVEQERIEALEELDRTTADNERLDQEIRDIEEEARRAGVPPGWLR